MCNTARFWYDGVIDSPLWRSEVITSPVMIHVFSNCSDIIHVGYTRCLFNTRTHSACSLGSVADDAANIVFTLNVYNSIDPEKKFAAASIWPHRCLTLTLHPAWLFIGH